MYSIPKAIAFLFFFNGRQITVMQNWVFDLFHISVDMNSSSEYRHFYLLKTQLRFNLVPPKNSYLGCDFCFNICGQGHGLQILWKADCEKGTLFRTGAYLPSGKMGREERRNRANSLRNGPMPGEV